jgi:hypothetical protein
VTLSSLSIVSRALASSVPQHLMDLPKHHNQRQISAKSIELRLDNLLSKYGDNLDVIRIEQQVNGALYASWSTTLVGKLPLPRPAGKVTSLSLRWNASPIVLGRDFSVEIMDVAAPLAKVGDLLFDLLIHLQEWELLILNFE